jgi:hypothetical protein
MHMRLGCRVICVEAAQRGAIADSSSRALRCHVTRSTQLRAPELR